MLGLEARCKPRTAVIPFLQGRKLKHREVMELPKVTQIEDGTAKTQSPAAWL